MPDVFAHGMLSMAYLGAAADQLGPAGEPALISGPVRLDHPPVHGQPTCSGRVSAIQEVDGEKRATVDLTVTLADGTVTLSGDAVIAIN